MTVEVFIEKAKKVHGERYDYSLVEYFNLNAKVEIICHKHGVFKQRASNHLYGRGCRKCGFIIGSEKQRCTKEDFIEKSNIIHNFEYNYTGVIYKNNITPVSIECEIHGTFKQTPGNHLSGQACPKCNGGIVLDSNTFINKAREIHNDKYDYSLAEYKNAHTKVEIICPVHGVFMQSPNNHSRGQDCPECVDRIKSKGEKEVCDYLVLHNIDFKSQYKFKDCKDVNSLPFDFYLPKRNTCIEYDGIQHFEPIEFFGGEDGFINLKKRDEIKNKFCEINNIKLVRVRYDADIKSIFHDRGIISDN